MSKPFTPGPWIAEYQGPESEDAYAILTEKGWGRELPWIASVLGTNVSVKDPAEIAANAHLIAAAPDLYEALKNTLAVIKCLDVYLKHGTTIQQAQDALAKAVQP